MLVLILSQGISQKHACKPQADGDADRAGDEAGQHKAVVKDVVADTGRSRAVKGDACEDGGVAGDEKESADRGEDTNHHRCRDAEREPERRECPERACLTENQ